MLVLQGWLNSFLCASTNFPALVTHPPKNGDQTNLINQSADFKSILQIECVVNQRWLNSFLCASTSFRALVTHLPKNGHPPKNGDQTNLMNQSADFKSILQIECVVNQGWLNSFLCASTNFPALATHPPKNGDQTT